jgi:hypothetical protein
VVADKPATFSWRELASDEPLTEADKRTLLLMRPVLDFKALEPGGAAVDAIRKAAADANLARITGHGFV